jgi:hypothetical protein
MCFVFGVARGWSDRDSPGLEAGALANKADAPMLAAHCLRSGHRQQMTQATIDVVGIGNAIVDVVAHADDAFLAPDARSRSRRSVCHRHWAGRAGSRQR